MQDILTLRDEEISGATERRALILLRWTMILATSAVVLAASLYQPIPLAAIGLLIGFAASNLLLYAYWSAFEARPGSDILLAILDTLFLISAIFLAGIAASELLVLTLLAVFLVAFGRDIRQIIAAGVAVGFLYLWMTAQLRPEGLLLHPAFLVRVPFLYSVALYFGCWAARSSVERRQTKQVLRERRELRALMDILETINSTLDLHRVMLTITTKMAQAVSLERCSILLIEGGENRSLVLASSDRPDVDRLEIDLAKYPEVRRAIDSREPVLIQDVQSHPLMEGVRELIAGAGFNSILVVPMICRDDLVGTLLLRAASSETQFSPRVVAFCQAIASASANAVKNALLYRQVREESARHRATIEKLQNILQYSMDLIVTTDLEGCIIDFNRTAEQSLGYRKEEIVGRPLTDIFHEVGDRSQFLSLLRGAGRIDNHGAAMTARDGSERTFDLTVAVVRNELGEVVGSVWVGKKMYAYH